MLGDRDGLVVQPDLPVVAPVERVLQPRVVVALGEVEARVGATALLAGEGTRDEMCLGVINYTD